MTTVGEVLKDAITKLSSVSDEPRTEAEYLLESATGLSFTQLVLQSEETLDQQTVATFNAEVSRRLNGEPIAYILGRKDFHEISLKVNSSVLIPRSDTEQLVEQALMRILIDQPNKILDLGTGSGAIALSIAKQRPLCKVTAVDVCSDACAMARDNAKELMLENVHILCGSWFSLLQGQHFNIIVSNSPYIEAGDPHLSRGDLRFEPHSALLADDKGLACFKEIAGSAADHLLPDGSLLFEHGLDQSPCVQQILSDNNFSQICTYRDLSNHPRVTAGVLINPSVVY